MQIPSYLIFLLFLFAPVFLYHSQFQLTFRVNSKRVSKKKPQMWKPISFTKVSFYVQLFLFAASDAVVTMVTI